jgi:ACS family tartrate transporter-like MFS transporter
MGVVILFLLPDSPASAPWLSRDERDWIERQLAADLTSSTRHADRGIVRALLNPMVLGFTLVNFIVLGSYYAFNLSAPQLLGGATHLSVAKVGYLVAAGGILGAAAMILAGWHSDYRRERFLHLAIPLLTSGLGYAVLSIASDPLIVIGAYWSVIMSNAAIAASFWLAPGDVLAPRSMAISVAVINSVGQLGSFVSPWLWGIAKDATGSFRLGLSVLPVGFVLAAVIVIWLAYQTRTRHTATVRIASETA